MLLAGDSLQKAGIVDSRVRPVWPVTVVSSGQVLSREAQHQVVDVEDRRLPWGAVTAHRAAPRLQAPSSRSAAPSW